VHRTRNDILIGAFLVVVFLWFLWEARDWPFRTRFFPWVIGFPILALALIQLGLSIRTAISGRPDQRVAGEVQDAGEGADETLLHRRTLGIAAWAVAFALGLWIFGFKVGGPLLTLVFLRFQAHETWRMSIGYAFIVYLFFFAGLELGLALPLPPGLLAASLGLDSFDSYLVNPILNLVSGR
jgi:hypothetical protein